MAAKRGPPRRLDGEALRGSPLWYRSAGYTKLTSGDELLSCTDRARNGKEFAGAIYDRQSNDWKVCLDVWDPAGYPDLAAWQKNAEKHISGVCNPDGSRCVFGNKTSWHR